MKCLKCHHDALEGSEHCKAHGDETQRVRRYLLTGIFKAQQDKLEQVENPASLRSEVLLATNILNTRINHLGENPTASELAGAHSAINDSLRTIEKLVASMHKQDLASGEVLTRDTAFKLIAAIVDAVSNRLSPFEDHPDYSTVIDGISTDLQELVDNTSNE